MKKIRYFGISAAFCFGLYFLILSFSSSGQDAPVASAAGNTPDFESVEPFKVKMSVEEVRLDVVVLDKKGNPVTDLTAADFEVYQDKKRQEVKASVYVEYQSDAMPSAEASPNALNFLPPSTALKKKDVRRTIVFIIDDAAMSFENNYYTKMALRNFLEKQMQPGDLVSILRTDYGNQSLNMFLSDKREAVARINALPMTQSLVAQIRNEIKNAGSSRILGISALIEQFRQLLKDLHENRIATVSHCLSVMVNLPGRKIMIMATPFATYSPTASDLPQGEDDVYSLYEKTYIKLADDALRAGVVVNFLDINGLEISESFPVDASRWLTPPGNSHSGPPESAILNRLKMAQSDPVLLPNPLSTLTGGVSIINSNFFLDGIGKETESLLKGYYLISYVPPAGTFTAARGGKDEYRRLKVTVNRKDTVVHTRDGFFSRLEDEPDSDAPKNTLIEAIHSPFLEDGINVNMAAGYVKDGKEGYLLRSWIHIDAEDVKIVDTEGGGNRISLDALFLTSDINGNIQDSSRVDFALTNINRDWIKKHGVRFSMLLPVKEPGPYYVRIAVQDTESKKTGAAYQFLDIPDLKKKGLKLSNIFMLTSADDLQWMNSDVKKEVGQGVFFPMLQAEEVRSPALRTYKSGDNLMTLAMLYNADAKAISRSEIETQTILYKDGKEFLRGVPVPITPGQIEDPGSIPLLNRLSVGTNMPPGDYVLQIVVTDKKNSKKNEGNASQFTSFTVTE